MENHFLTDADKLLHVALVLIFILNWTLLLDNWRRSRKISKLHNEARKIWDQATERYGHALETIETAKGHVEKAKQHLDEVRGIQDLQVSVKLKDGEIVQ